MKLSYHSLLPLCLALIFFSSCEPINTTPPKIQVNTTPSITATSSPAAQKEEQKKGKPLNLIAHDLLMEQQEYLHPSFDSLIKSKKFYEAIEVLNLAAEMSAEQTFQDQLSVLRKKVYFLQETKFDYAYYGVPNDSLIIVESKGKYGLYSTKGKELYPPTFDELMPYFTDSLLIVEQNNLTGFLSYEGKLIHPTVFSAIDPQSFHPLILVHKNNRFGFLDQSGKVVRPLQYKNIGMGVSDGVIFVQENNLWGGIDTFGQTIFPPKFDSLDFSFNPDGLALAHLNGNQFFINTKGEKVENPAFK
ncbi:WG repeat-containing protein [Saprospira grandis]|uniref:WG repeat-containing protein n=1 Tax=Saprospira grandis TaxID=1008 RepID=UPI0022DD834A|nr:WG repeat-containing protein [Saprospira grandis]WBM74260.1 WG repeat-containing protein [Saprospira grandis]